MTFPGGLGCRSNLQRLHMWLISALVVGASALVLRSGFGTGGEDGIPYHAVVLSLCCFLGLEICLSVALDDLLSFVSAGLLSILAGCLLHATVLPSQSFVAAAVAGAFSGAFWGMAILVMPFDCLRKRITVPRLLVLYTLLLGMCLLFAGVSKELTFMRESIMPLFPATLAIFGVSWIVFAVNALTAVNSLAVIRVFIVLAGPILVFHSLILPWLAALENARQLGGFLASFTFAYLCPIALVYIARCSKSTARIEERRKNITMAGAQHIRTLGWYPILVVMAAFSRTSGAVLSSFFGVLFVAAFLAIQFLLITVLISRMRQPGRNSGVDADARSSAVMDSDG